MKTLRRRDVIASNDEIRAAARHYVRTVTGFQPSARHEAAFEAAAYEVTLASNRVLQRIRGAARARAPRGGPQRLDRIAASAGG